MARRKNSSLKPVFFFFTLSVMLTGTFIIAGSFKRQIADDIWNQLGIDQTQAHRNIYNSYIEGHFRYSGAKLAKNLSVENRLAVVKELAAYAKKYLKSAEFQKEYKALKERRKPKPPIDQRTTPEVIRAEERKRLEENLKSFEANINNPNPKIRNSIPGRIEQTKKDLAELDNPENRVIKSRIDQANRSHEYALKAHADALAKLEIQYPDNTDLLVRKRLQEILDVTADVDYQAELKEQYNKKVFVNPVYQRKHDDWKLAFRAGKETTDAVRTIAQQWLQELK